MKYRVCVYTLCIILILVFQTTIFDYIAILNVKPNILLIFVVSIGLLRGNVEGAVFGLISGMAFDMLVGTTLGFYALLGMLLGFSAGSVNKGLYKDNLLVVIFFTFLFTIAYEITVFIIRVAFYSGDITKTIYSLRFIILPESIYNSVLSIFVYIFVIKLNDWINRHDNKRKNRREKTV